MTWVQQQQDALGEVGAAAAVGVVGAEAAAGAVDAVGAIAGGGVGAMAAIAGGGVGTEQRKRIKKINRWYYKYITTDHYPINPTFFTFFRFQGTGGLNLIRYQ